MRLILPPLLAALSLFSSCISQAEQPADSSLTVPYPEFTAQYKAEWKGTWIPVTVEATRSLSYRTVKTGSDSPETTGILRFEADSSVAGLEELSEFRWNNNQLQPLRYHYLRTGLFSEPDRYQSFDWMKKEIRNAETNQLFENQWSDLLQDNLSYHVQASIDLSEGKTEFTYPVFDRKRVKDFRFRVVGPEMLKTPVGTLRTIKTEQLQKKKSRPKTYIWFATDYDYLLIRLKQVKKGKDTYQIDITRAEINGKTLGQAGK